MHNEKKEFVYKTTLKTVYGFTDSMIADLGDPDKYVKNPHYKTGPRSSLYRIERIERWCDDNRERLEAAPAKRAKRTEAAQRANQTKFDQIIEWAESVELEFEPLASYDDAWNSAETYYALSEWADSGYVSWNGVIAYMRHNCTNYDALLRQIKGLVGTHEAYTIIRRRVDDLVEKWLNESREAESA
jgi:hypothetical protein